MGRYTSLLAKEYMMHEVLCTGLKEKLSENWKEHFKEGEVYKQCRWSSIGTEFEGIGWTSGIIVVEAANKQKYIVDKSQFEKILT
jgi:hypothetical protein